MSQKRALITGITGQDGSYLAEFLLSKNYKVFGVTRRTSTPNYERIKHFQEKVELIPGDLLDQQSLISAIDYSQPDEIYNLAAQSFVATSWSQPVLTGEFTALGVTRMLESIRQVKKNAKFYQASSSEMFGMAKETPQSEKTPFHPRSPYGVAKVYGHWITINYRESYDLFTVSGILFNHESPRRGLEFVTRKISHGVAKIHLKQSTHIVLGNLNAKRDWGFAGDYVKAIWLMLQQDKPDDFVIATGENHSVEDFVKEAFKVIGIANWKKYVKVSKELFRPAEVDFLIGDASKARKVLAWKPSVSFKDLVKMMVEADIRLLKHNSR
ncbi:GDP-mannose 4,6-dehydratase [Candidatus Curtissbacteria bacterium RBG_13_35_7]|uniref:GDP-mannose 4,6-dehydratase n=1 Tax=Candidatus Curtissbacteria bacterium RBG_13_35_7 TaxID=1797705 RepID=A0A1F5G1J8_9BACT|nr:MAG: GDP-mannose 4,6-dehydratase [Candidatus Curtissbacteria bacterium RBG_13_35_7]